jgi:hypothetical protein
MCRGDNESDFVGLEIINPLKPTRQRIRFFKKLNAIALDEYLSQREDSNCLPTPSRLYIGHSRMMRNLRLRLPGAG